MCNTDNLISYKNIDFDDSDDDYDDELGNFTFGNVDPYAKKERFIYQEPEIDLDEKLYIAVIDGNLKDLIEQIKQLNFNINEPVRYYGLSLLHYACRYGHLNIVKYLLDNDANSNCEIDSITPLMEICGCLNDKMPENILKIVKLLLNYDANINVSDKYGMTPFMFACKYGYLDIVKLLIKSASLDACNNEGKTVIYHAIENNHIEIVKFLIKSGINCDVIDCKGYTPSQVAENNGFYDIYEILPKKIIPYCVPTNFLSYNSVHDHIPRIFLKSDIPEYFQEIYTILNDMNMGYFIDYFALAKINLTEFLIISDKRLKEIGFEFPYQRNRLRLGLLHFHLNHWSKKSIARVKPKEPDNFYDILIFSANHLQNLIVINSTIKYVQINLDANQFGVLDAQVIDEFRNSLNKYKEILNNLKDTAKYLHSFCPDKPPLYIEYNEKKKKPNMFKCLLKYSFLLGISIVICLKMKKIVH